MTIQVPPPTLHDTRPNPIATGRRGCRFSPVIVFFAALLFPLFCCGMTLLSYLVFPPAPLDILVLGLDSRPGEGMAGRTDSNMLVGIDPSRLRTSVLSIPRDLFINVPGYGSQRINTINVLGEQERQGGGVDLLVASIAQDFGVNVDRYARFDFQAFVALVDAVGGITIDVERTIVDDLYPNEDGSVMSVRFESGLQYMNGDRALIYARTRHADDDYQRASRQQQVLSALLGKLSNPAYWPAAVNVLNQYADTNLTVADMIRYAPAVLLNLGRFDQLVINRDYIAGSPNGGAGPDYAKLQPWISERFD
jgi:LCP family protein required for cell wall assembly